MKGEVRQGDRRTAVAASCTCFLCRRCTARDMNTANTTASPTPQPTCRMKSPPTSGATNPANMVSSAAAAPPPLPPPSWPVSATSITSAPFRPAVFSTPTRFWLVRRACKSAQLRRSNSRGAGGWRAEAGKSATGACVRVRRISGGTMEAAQAQHSLSHSKAAWPHMRCKAARLAIGASQRQTAAGERPLSASRRRSWRTHGRGCGWPAGAGHRRKKQGPGAGAKEVRGLAGKGTIERVAFPRQVSCRPRPPERSQQARDAPPDSRWAISRAG